MNRLALWVLPYPLKEIPMVLGPFGDASQPIPQSFGNIFRDIETGFYVRRILLTFKEFITIYDLTDL